MFDWVVFSVRGEPVPQPRHRKAKGNRFYLPKNHPVHAFKQEVQFRFLQERPSWWNLDGPKEIVVEIYLERNSKKVGRKHHGDGSIQWAADVKVDVDNVDKAVFDALKNVAWNDDRQVVASRTFKMLQSDDAPPMTVLAIRQAPPVDPSSFEWR